MRECIYIVLSVRGPSHDRMHIVLSVRGPPHDRMHIALSVRGPPHDRMHIALSGYDFSFLMDLYEMLLGGKLPYKLMTGS